MVELEWKVLVGPVGVASTVEDGGCESWTDYGAAGSIAHSVVEAR